MSNLTLIYTVGCPGCGKTTWAKQFLNDHKNDEFKWVRISRDDIRMMSFNIEFDVQYESYVSIIEEQMVRSALENGMNVLIDATHIQKKSRNKWLKIARDIGGINIIEHGFDCHLEECIDRNSKRDRKVPEHIIRNMFEQLRNVGCYKHEIIESIPEHVQEKQTYCSYLPDAVIVDLDGTIADNTWRNVYDASRADEDPPIEGIIDLVDILRHKYVSDWSNQDEDFNNDLIFVTGRSEKYREQTTKFLQKHIIDRFYHYSSEYEIPELILHMRQNNDNRPDTQVKREIYLNKIKNVCNVRYVLDDRPSVCRMYRRLGLTVLQLNDKEF